MRPPPQPFLALSRVLPQAASRVSPLVKGLTEHRSTARPIPRPPSRPGRETIARKNGLTLSRTIASLLEEAIRQQLHVQHAVLLQPIIEQAIGRQMRAYSGRIAVLLVRSLFASEQTRGLVTNILGRQPGITQPVLRDILNSAGRSAKRNITQITPQLAALVEEIKEWMEKEEADDTHV